MACVTLSLSKGVGCAQGNKNDNVVFEDLRLTIKITQSLTECDFKPKRTVIQRLSGLIVGSHRNTFNSRRLLAFSP